MIRNVAIDRILHMEAKNRVKVVLVEKQRTNRWLAEQLRKTENMVSRWCTNKLQPSLENLYGIAEIFDAKDLSLFHPQRNLHYKMANHAKEKDSNEEEENRKDRHFFAFETMLLIIVMYTR